MAQYSKYFSHDADARLSPKLIRVRMVHGAAGYGVYFMLLERLRCEDDYTSETDYAVISFDLQCDEEMVQSVVEDFDLFVLSDDGKRFWSQSFMERMEHMEQKRNDISERRREAANARWARERENKPGNNGSSNQREEQKDKKSMQMQCKCNASAMQSDASAMQNDAKHNITYNNITENKRESNDARARDARDAQNKSLYIKYREFVSMTESEYQKLVAKYGIIQTERMIDILDNYKGSKGKKYRSDYRAILSWVVSRYEEERQRGNKSALMRSNDELERLANEIDGIRSATSSTNVTKRLS